MPKCVPPYYYTSGLSGPFSHLATICEDQSSAEIKNIIWEMKKHCIWTFKEGPTIDLGKDI